MSSADRGSRVDLQPARTGRPRLRAQQLRPNERVLVSARLPAELAARIYETANRNQKPVSCVVADLLSQALENPGAAAT